MMPAPTTVPPQKDTRTIRKDAANALRAYAGATFARITGRVREGNVEHRLAVPGVGGGLWVDDTMTVEGMIF